VTDAATPEWAELLQAAAAAQLFELHTSMPGQVVAVHEGADKRQFVDVRPCLRRALEADDASAEPFVEEELPILPRVPVGYPQGGGFFVSLPLQAGDFVLLVFSERSIDRWIATASKARQAAVSTGDIGTHSLDGAIAIPCGPAPSANLLEGVSGEDLVIGGPAGVMLRISPLGQIRWAEGAGESYVALATLVALQLTRVQADIAALKAAVVAGCTAVAAIVPPPTLPAPAFVAFGTAFGTAAALTPSVPGAVAATRVKAR
jgi:hypothetical protein